jgi:hypothetical protein
VRLIAGSDSAKPPAIRRIDRRFTAIDRRFVPRSDRRFAVVFDNSEFRRQSEEMRGHFDETRRHFEVIAKASATIFESFADGIAGCGQSERLDKHEARITRSGVARGAPAISYQPTATSHQLPVVRRQGCSDARLEAPCARGAREDSSGNRRHFRISP